MQNICLSHRDNCRRRTEAAVEVEVEAEAKSWTWIYVRRGQSQAKGSKHRSDQKKEKPKRYCASVCRPQTDDGRLKTETLKD